ncbi:MAG: transcriptional regulator [Nitrospira sp. LK70]|nr:transcriptional regulator [Nitrospira sp. LK70]
MFSFIETKLFSQLPEDYLPDDEYAKLQEALIERPERGVLIPGSGGVRKLRWSGSGRGKCGGIRVIYYAKVRDGVLFMLTIYAKNEDENIHFHILRKIKEDIDA